MLRSTTFLPLQKRKLMEGRKIPFEPLQKILNFFCLPFTNNTYTMLTFYLLIFAIDVNLTEIWLNEEIQIETAVYNDFATSKGPMKKQYKRLNFTLSRLLIVQSFLQISNFRLASQGQVL